MDLPRNSEAAPKKASQDGRGQSWDRVGHGERRINMANHLGLYHETNRLQQVKTYEQTYKKNYGKTACY